LSLDALIQALANRRPDLHVVLTGRNAPFELTDFADLVTDMRCMKHPYPAKKIAPQPGIEF
jgi:cob(I)alamin adenosyltransferase